MLIGSGLSTPSYTASGGTASTATSTSAVKPNGTSDWSRTAAQAPVAKESIHRMMSMTSDPEVSGLLAIMKADEAASAGYDAVVSAYGDS